MYLSSDGSYSTATNRAFFVGDVGLAGRELQKKARTLPKVKFFIWLVPYGWL